MNKTIWKFTLTPNTIQPIEMPIGAEIISLQTQHEAACFWAIVDPHSPKEKRHFEVYATGDVIPEAKRVFIGTFQLSGGNLVFHVFELISLK